MHGYPTIFAGIPLDFIPPIPYISQSEYSSLPKLVSTDLTSLAVLLSIMNCVTVNGAARFQIVFTITKVLGLILIIATGMVRLGQGKNT